VFSLRDMWSRRLLTYYFTACTPRYDIMDPVRDHVFEQEIDVAVSYDSSQARDYICGYDLYVHLLGTPVYSV
jgi:hypothetical protein